jgi:hypothetical protein
MNCGIVHDERVAGVEQVPGHRQPHAPDADEADRHAWQGGPGGGGR